MDVIEKIKAIDIKLLLDTLGIKTNNKKWLFDIRENKFTDSYTYSIKYNIVKSHNLSKEWRPYGNPLNFYIGHTGATVSEAIEWFKDTFNIEVFCNTYKPIEEIETLNDEDRVSSYLFLRGINYKALPNGLVSLVRAKTYGKLAPKGETDCISVLMQDTKGVKTGYQYRSLLGKGFYTNGSDGMFYHFTKKLKKDYIFIVEGMTDYLTVRQYTEQVIGFKSANVLPTDDMIALINKFNKVYLLFDNDSAGKKCKEGFKEAIDSDIYELDVEEDINELGKQLYGGLVESIISGSIRTKEKIFALIDYSDGLNRGKEELLARTEESVMSWGFEKFDDKLGYLLPGQLIVVGGVTGVGKSTVVNQIGNNVSRQGFKVARMSLEDRLEENRINDIFYEVTRLRTKKKLRVPTHSIFEANLFNDIEYPGISMDINMAIANLNKFNSGIIDLSHKKMVDIAELENLFKDVVINKGVKLVIIDHLHYVKFEKNARHDLAIEEFMHSLNDLLRKYNVTCILVSHYRKLQKDEEPNNNSFKDGASIAQVANKVIHIINDPDDICDGGTRAVVYHITKNRGKSWLGIIKGGFHNGRISMKESELSIKRRESKKLGFNY